MGHGSHFTSPVTFLSNNLIGVLFIDSTNLTILHHCLMTDDQVWMESHEVLMIWGALLIATDGTLRPEKCHYSLVDYTCVDRE